MNPICFIIVILIWVPAVLVFADSETEDELLNEGNVLFNQGKYFDAVYYYDKILSLNPQHEVAKNNIFESFDNFSYRNLDGYVEIIVRDSDGHLITYSKSLSLRILNDKSAEKFLDEWDVREVITRNGQDFEVLQTETLQTIENELIISNVKKILHLNISKIHLLDTIFRQILVENGDTVNYFYTVFRPIE